MTFNRVAAGVLGCWFGLVAGCGSDGAPSDSPGSSERTAQEEVGHDEAPPAENAHAEALVAQRVEVEVTGEGYVPSEIRAHAGQPLTLVVTRTSDEGCGDTLVIASQEIERELPLNEAVEIEFTPSEAGELRFTCGMDMYDGRIVVQ